MENICNKCGAELKKDAKFCQECGDKIESIQSEIENASYCPNCGSNVANSENFCEECGFNLKQAPKKSANFFDENRKIIAIILVILAIIIVCYGALFILGDMSSNDYTEIDYGTQTVTLDNVDFKIPGDYRLIPTSIDYGYENHVTTYKQSYSNSDEEITLIVMSSPGSSVDAAEVVEETGGGVTKTMFGYKGTYSESSDGYSFSFGMGNKLCMIVVSSPYVFDQIEVVG